MFEVFPSQEFKLFALIGGANLISFGFGMILGRMIWKKSKNRRVC